MHFARNPRIIVSIPVLALLFALNAVGDTVELKTGERLEGTFRQAGSTGVTIETAGQLITIPLKKVLAIYFGGAKTRPHGPAPSQEALDALRALRSVTEAGISYREYAPRVLDTKREGGQVHQLIHRRPRGIARRNSSGNAGVYPSC